HRPVPHHSACPRTLRGDRRPGQPNARPRRPIRAAHAPPGSACWPGLAHPCGVMPRVRSGDGLLTYPAKPVAARFAVAGERLPEVCDMGKKKDQKKQEKRGAAEVQASPAARPEAGDGPPPRMKRKEYERQMRRLHGELVAVQEWVKASGAKICVVFEGRDTAG